MDDKEFIKLLSLNKLFEDTNILLPKNGEKKIYQLKSASSKDKFFMDVNRSGKIELSKFTLQNRYAATKIPLVRIDIDSPPHINPDGTKLSRNHIHIFKETDFDTGNLPWAYELSSIPELGLNCNSLNFMEVFYAFCSYCNIEATNIQGVM